MALKLFKRGAEVENADGMYNLALMYSRGRCVEVIHDIDIEWLLKGFHVNSDIAI